MKKLAREASSLPEIQLLARTFPDPVSLDRYLRQYWRVKPDPVEAEFIRHPKFQLEHAMQSGFYEGDCDDAATFGASILRAGGYACAFVAYRIHGQQEFSHVNLHCGGFEIDPVTPLEHLPVRNVEEVMTLEV